MIHGKEKFLKIPVNKLVRCKEMFDKLID